jgi:hypothetical protein
LRLVHLLGDGARLFGALPPVRGVVDEGCRHISPSGGARDALACIPTWRMRAGFWRAPRSRKQSSDMSARFESAHSVPCQGWWVRRDWVIRTATRWLHYRSTAAWAYVLASAALSIAPVCHILPSKSRMRRMITTRPSPPEG